jgi:hypothetical protein
MEQQPSIRLHSNGTSESTSGITGTSTGSTGSGANGNNNTHTNMNPTGTVTSVSSSSSSSYVELYTFLLSILVFLLNAMFLIYCHYNFYLNYNTKIQYTTSFVSHVWKNCINVLLQQQQIYIHTFIDDHLSLQVNNTSHTNVTATTTTTTTILSVSDYYPNMDMIFITAIVIMTFEILDFITKNFGSKFSYILCVCVCVSDNLFLLFIIPLLA